jgi:ATP-binding cassette subfamily C protein CydD
LYAATLLAVAAAACWVALVLVLSVVVGRVFQGGATLVSVRGLVVAMLGLLLIRGAALWSSEVAAQRAADRVKSGLRERLAAKLLALGPAYTRSERTGELVYAAGEGVETIDAFAARYAPARLLVVIVPALVAAVVFVLDPWTVLILLIAGPFLLLLMALIGRRVRDLTGRRERELAWLNAHFLDVLRGLPTLKMFGRSAEQAETIESVSRRHGSTTMDVLSTAFQTTLVLEWGATAATALVAIETSVRLMSGGLPFERALAVLLLAPEFFLPIRRLSAEYHAGRSGAAAASRVYATIDEPIRLRGPSRATRALPSRFDLRFDDVHVVYEQGAPPALAGCSLHVAHGTAVALVGATGAGKTTVANVLLRFIEPTRGRVMVGGVPIADMDPLLWRTQVAYVPQHPTLFHGTVAENLLLAKPEASHQEVVAAARAAQAHGFVTELPGGYATPIGEGGSRLSGGERQRLALARAFLKDAPLLILDEPTSHLDDESERVVLDATGRLMQGRTVLLISHRAEAIANADVVAVMREGRIVETAVREPSGGWIAEAPAIVGIQP